MEESEMQALERLQKRVREATGPDRELDVAILDALSDPNSVVLPHYTTDPEGLGACVALLNSVIPEWHWAVSGNRKDSRGACVASVHVPYGYKGPAPYPEGIAHHDSAVHALLLAIISAKLSKEKEAL